MKESREVQERDKTKKLELRQKMQDHLQALWGVLQGKDDKLREQIESYLQATYKPGGLWKTEKRMENNPNGIGKVKSK